MPDKFAQSKSDTLKRNDKSYKGSWDKHILKLCNKINSLENYYTTSSCSGRVVVMIEKKQKDRELFLFVSHEKISFDELKRELLKIVKSFSHPPAPAKNLLQSKVAQDLLTDKNVNVANFDEQDSTISHKIKLINPSLRSSVINYKQIRGAPATSELIKFKLDPCILHVCCKTLEDADALLKKAQVCGWKKSGILSFGEKIILELNSTERLEFPIIKNERILVDNAFLKLVVEESNRKLEESWEKIKKLEKVI